jgi:hypothetical protein
MMFCVREGVRRWLNFVFVDFLFTRAAGQSEYQDLDTRSWHDKAHHFRALVNLLEKLIVNVEDYGELALAGDQLIIGPL